MNKIIEFLKQSNRYKHLIGGLLVGILAFTPWTALYAAAVAAPRVTEEQTERRTLGLDRLVSYRHRRHIVGPILVDSVML